MFKSWSCVSYFWCVPATHLQALTCQPNNLGGTMTALFLGVGFGELLDTVGGFISLSVQPSLDVTQVEYTFVF